MGLDANVPRPKKPIGGKTFGVRRIVCVVCLLALAAGCGGGSRHVSTVRGVPGSLARSWAKRADAVAAAAAAGDSCRASRLAQSLQNDVIARQSSVPLRYYRVLLRAVNHLANRFTCVPTPVTVVTTTQAPPPPPQGHGPPGHRKHGHGGGGGGDQGGDGG